GNALVQHGGDYVDERNVGDDGAISLRRHVGYRAHEQAAGAAPGRDHLILGGVAMLHEVPRAVDEVREAVSFVQQTPILVPLPPELLTAANVCDRDYESTVEQTHPVAAERRIRRDPVGAVSVLVERRAAVQFRSPAISDRHGDLLAVAG